MSLKRNHRPRLEMCSIRETTNERPGGAGERQAKAHRVGPSSFGVGEGASSQILALPHMSRRISGKCLNLSGPQFHYLSDGAVDNTYLQVV